MHRNVMRCVCEYEELTIPLVCEHETAWEFEQGNNAIDDFTSGKERSLTEIDEETGVKDVCVALGEKWAELLLFLEFIEDASVPGNVPNELERLEKVGEGRVNEGEEIDGWGIGLESVGGLAGSVGMIDVALFHFDDEGDLESEE